MSVWSKYPFVKMLIPFALGIWCWVCLPAFRMSLSTLVVVALALFAVAAATAFVLKSYRHNWVFGAVMLGYLFLVGYALACVQEAENQKDYFRNYQDGVHYYVARVYDYPTERTNTIRTVLELEYQFGDSLASRYV